MFGYGYHRGFGRGRYRARACWPYAHPSGWYRQGRNMWVGGPGYWGDMGADYGPYPQDYAWDAGASQDEITVLRQEVSALRQQVEEALSRLAAQEL